jgi:hypothetical protein
MLLLHSFQMAASGAPVENAADWDLAHSGAGVPGSPPVQGRTCPSKRAFPFSLLLVIFCRVKAFPNVH